MMGRLNHEQEQFFYSFRLDDAVPGDRITLFGGSPRPLPDGAPVVELLLRHSYAGRARHSECGRDTRHHALSEIQARILEEGITFFGLWGFMVPAIALQPFLTTSRANCFASASVSKRRVARGTRFSLSRLGTMFDR
jgi:hypothetical protein